MVSIAFLAAAVVSAAAASPAQPTDVEGVTVVADIDVRLSVAVAGDMNRDVMVVSNPPGLRCGAGLYQFDSRDQFDRRDPRLCWVRVRRNRPVTLAAQGLGRYGVDWTVQWIGCTPLANGTVCEVTPQGETQVEAVFTTLGS